jgi:drug/metabolite transporter (DMT)-like permease
VAAFGWTPSATTSGGEDYTLVFIAMIIGSINPIITWQTKEASWIEVEHVTSFLAVFVLNPAVYCVEIFLLKSETPALPSLSHSEAGLILLAGLGSFVGVAMQTRGYQMADPGKATMYCYLEIPFAYVLQTIGTARSVSMHSVLGAILVLSSCFLDLAARGYSQQKEHREKNARMPLLNSFGSTGLV